MVEFNVDKVPFCYILCCRLLRLYLINAVTWWVITYNFESQNFLKVISGENLLEVFLSGRNECT